VPRPAGGPRARDLRPPDLSGGKGRGRIFSTAAPDGSAITFKAHPITREALVVQGDPFYVPPYVGDKGWVGIRSKHTRTDWEEVAELIATSYCLVARRQLAARVTSPPPLDS
jgi:predicted DNA-binding protein (MmcQ/YjbR family)